MEEAGSLDTDCLGNALLLLVFFTPTEDLRLGAAGKKKNKKAKMRSGLGSPVRFNKTTPHTRLGPGSLGSYRHVADGARAAVLPARKLLSSLFSV